jgi:hypothetical protein
MADHLIETPFIYVYTTFKKRVGEGNGIIWVCHRCLYCEQDGELCDMVFGTKGDLLVHLAKHQKDGHGISDVLINRIASEIVESWPVGERGAVMPVMNLSEPNWAEFVRRPTVVSAFQWDHSMEDCIAQITKVAPKQFVMDTHWGGKRRMLDGDWVVRSPTGEVWLVDDGKFQQYYDRL